MTSEGTELKEVNVMLYRPVGPRELVLIEASGWKSFPPRLPEQPIFYPVLNEEYAREIARRWNVRDSGAGFVLRFAIDKAYIARFDVHQVGSNVHMEYWIPADELDDFNNHIVGAIEMIDSFDDKERYDRRGPEVAPPKSPEKEK
jgi:hypothetical protein